jgi:hypothetical protein
MMLNPDLLLKLSQLQHQDQLREVETWRLQVEAHRNRARFLGHLLHRLAAAARQRLGFQSRPNSVTPDLANSPR